MRIKEALRILELPPDTFKSCLGLTLLQTSNRLEELKRIAVNQRKKLAKKYHEGGTNVDLIKMKQINITVDEINKLKVEDLYPNLFSGQVKISSNRNRKSETTWSGFY